MQPVFLCHDLCRAFRRNVQLIHYVCVGCFHRNAHYILHEMLVAINNPGTQNEYIHVCCKLSTLRLSMDVLQIINE